jgi:hypothetical protein
MERFGAAVLVVVVAVVAAGCGGGMPAGEPETEAGAPAASGWTELPRGPLSPREAATGVWTGGEVLVVGGSDASPCPPSADCPLPETPPLLDGAAFDPASRTWRSIAPAPIPIGWASAAAVGDTTYYWVTDGGRPGERPAFLAYRISADRWDELPLPADEASWYALVAAGERLVAVNGSDEYGERPDFVFDAATETWAELPDDPQTDGFDRVMLWTGSELLLLDHELVPNPGSEKPSLPRIAAFDFETETWRRLPDSEDVLGAGPWLATNERVVFAGLGTADGGNNDWGREYPLGGILDLASGTWSELPQFPLEVTDSTFASGVVSNRAATYWGTNGWVLDLATDDWLELPEPAPEVHVGGRTVVAAGTDLFAFGGARFDSGTDFEGELLAEAYLWSPR